MFILFLHKQPVIYTSDARCLDFKNVPFTPWILHVDMINCFHMQTCAACGLFVFLLLILFRSIFLSFTEPHYKWLLPDAGVESITCTHKYTHTHSIYTQTSNAVYYKSSIVSEDTSPASVTMATVNKREENIANKCIDDYCLNWCVSLYIFISQIQVISLKEKQCTTATEWGCSDSFYKDHVVLTHNRFIFMQLKGYQIKHDPYKHLIPNSVLYVGVPTFVKRWYSGYQLYLWNMFFILRAAQSNQEQIMWVRFWSTTLTSYLVRPFHLFICVFSKLDQTWDYSR